MSKSLEEPQVAEGPHPDPPEAGGVAALHPASESRLGSPARADSSAPMPPSTLEAGWTSPSPGASAASLVTDAGDRYTSRVESPLNHSKQSSGSSPDRYSIEAASDSPFSSSHLPPKVRGRFDQDSTMQKARTEHVWGIFDRKRAVVDWIDVVWVLFVLGLAFLPPIHEIHKQLILLGFAVFQLFEGSLIAALSRRGRAYCVIIKILLATLLLGHTGGIAINSSYWPIFFVPVVTAAIYYGPLGTLLWTALASAAYCSYLVPALKVYELTEDAETTLAIRILFFFLAAMLVNRFVIENRKQVKRYQELSATLQETNAQLRRVEAEARRSERLAALGQMSAGLAHEIRNPLGVIKGSAEMLSQKLTGAQPLAGELAGYISSEVDRLNALVARFLDFARPTQLEMRPQRISEIVDRAIESVEHQYPNAQVRVERNYSAALPDVSVDEQLCERVFVNLIQNAFQSMAAADSNGEPVLKLSATAENSNGSAGVAVVVEDTGPGIPPDLREQIFNPFFTSKKDGVGLGLAIVAKIVDEHGGSIRLEESPRGARFRVFFPRKPQST
jgi:two-component system sensor histidine kinase HydH